MLVWGGTQEQCFANYYNLILTLKPDGDTSCARIRWVKPLALKNFSKASALNIWAVPLLLFTANPSLADNSSSKASLNTLVLQKNNYYSPQWDKIVRRYWNLGISPFVYWSSFQWENINNPGCIILNNLCKNFSIFSYSIVVPSNFCETSRNSFKSLDEDFKIMNYKSFFN